MITINQSVNVAFIAIEFEDAITLLPLMDSLVDEINTFHREIQLFLKLSKETESIPGEIKMARECLPESYAQYQVLYKLGFRANHKFASDFDINDYID